MIAVVTDAGACLPPDLADRLGIGVVTGETPTDLLLAYEELGCPVVAVHSRGLADAAERAARMATAQVLVVDAASTGFPVALSAWAAAEKLASSQDAEEAAAAAESLGLASLLVLGWGSGGPVPVLATTLTGLEPVAVAESAQEVADAVAAYVAEHAPGGGARIGVGHVGAAHHADAVAAALPGEVVRFDLSPLAAHTGPGALSVAFTTGS